jgi:formate-dependent nitrite reductase cytochrome c552 subunit
VRTPDLRQFPCTSCHLGRKIVLADTRVADAHRNIKVVHPTQTGGACSTCHAPDNVELLALKSGERATLDHTYRVCAQCHFSQAASWAGGAHGKRLDGWQGRRVLMGCADCHDPHQPAIEPRIPFRAPQITRIRGPNR